jgi:hypothetical protein
MTRSTDNLVDEIEVKDMQISDHFWLHCNLLGQKPKTFRKEITFRKTKALDATKFEEDFKASSLPSIVSLDSVADAVTEYNHGLSNLFDRHAPIVTKTVSVHPETPWFNEDIEIAKRE